MSPSSSKLDGLTAIVTGSSSGVGRGIALGFAQEGAKHVICVDLDPKPHSLGSGVDPTDLKTLRNGDKEEEELIPTHELLRQKYGQGKATFIRCDISVEKAAEHDVVNGEKTLGMADVLTEAVKLLGRLDVMVNCAAVGIFAIPTHETSLEVWNKTMSINSTGPFLGTKHALAQFVKQEPDANGFRGNIINISGIGASVAIRECAAYTASKAAIVGLSKTVAVDYGAKGIRCNVLCPGYIHTPMLQPSLDVEVGFREYLDTWIPLKRLGRPRDVAGAAIWLANGQESGYITGVSMEIDGGFTAR